MQPNMDHVDYRSIRLTPDEAELWDWAVDPMIEFWADAEDREHDGDRAYLPCPHARWEAILPARDGIGLISDDADVAEDLIYRLETQMADMAREEGCIDYRGRADRKRMAALRSVTTGKRLAAKVRAVFQIKDSD